MKIAEIVGVRLPTTEHDARRRLTIIWFGMLAANVFVVLGTYLLGGFGKLRDGPTQTAVLKAFDTVFFIFAPNLTAIFTYWFALKDQTEKALRNDMAFSISWWASILWGVVITTVHVFGGAATYENGLQTLSIHSNWLVSGALAFYFASGSKRATPQNKNVAKPTPPTA
jgi:cellulose synthase/poly-beta-1,6-N-acetylglucosamine synthase-like glycosyltransferase